MKWIVVAIVVIVVPYTILTLRYRKPGPAFQPYEDMKNRANVARLLSAGYRRIPLPASLPAEASGRAAGGATVSTAPGGLPESLRSTLVEPLLLPADITNVIAASIAYTAQPYGIQIMCTLPNDNLQLAGAALFVRDREIIIAPTFEAVGGELLTRSRQATVLLSVPARALAAGDYNVVVAGAQSSRMWTLQLRE